MLDRFLPYWEVRERHEVEVKAPLERTYAVARGMDLERSWLVRAVFRGREWLFRQPRDARATPGPLVDQTLALGWGLLYEKPGHQLVMGAVTEPWRGDVRFRALPPGESPLVQIRRNQMFGFATAIVWILVPGMAALIGGALVIAWSVIVMIWRASAHWP